MNLEQQENQLYNEYNSSPANLHKLMNHQNLEALLQLGNQSTNPTILQIIGTLIATYVEYNYQDIKEYQKIYDFAWQTINRISTDVFAVYHFFGSILANILFYYYNQFECDYFQNCLKAIMSSKDFVGFIILEQIMKKFRPPHSKHKEVIQTYDSQHRTVKNLFYRDNLEWLLDLVQIVLCNQQLGHLVDPAIEFFTSLIETEFITDSKEKDWHILKKVEVKNNRGLHAQLREFKQSIINAELQQLMLSNSALEFLDPTRSEIKKIWLKINNFSFLQLLLNKISQHPKLWSVLSKVCKIFKKHFKQEEQTIGTIYSITQYMSQIDLNQVDQALYLKCASSTLFINTQQDWIQLNLQLALNAQTYYHMLQGLKFARQLARIQRSKDCSTFHQIGMPIINQYFYKWALNPQTWCKDQEVQKYVKYQIRVIATHMITNYLNLFAEIMQTSQDQHIILVAFEYYLLGLTSAFRAAYYQSNVHSRYQRYPTDELLYPINLKAFENWNYKEFFSQAIQFGLNYAIMYEETTKRTHNFFYYIWKLFFQDTEFYEPSLLQNINLQELFNFSRALNFEDDAYKMKSLKIIKQCKISYRDGNIQISKIILPPYCFLIFQQNKEFENYSIDRLFYQMKTKLKNLESQIQFEYMDQMQVVSKFIVELMQLIASIQRIDWRIQLLSSIFKEANENCYHEFISRLHKVNYFDVFNQFNVKLIALLYVMINPKYVSSLPRDITEGFYDKIYHLTEYFVTTIRQNYIYFQQERQIGRESQKNIYEQFYQPIIKLLKLYTKLQCLNKSSATNVSKVKEKIYSYIFDILNMINQNDVLNYIHKMKPLFEVCQTLISFEIPRKIMDDGTISRILLLYDLALQRQDQHSFSLVLNSICEILNQHSFIVQRFQGEMYCLIEQCLTQAFQFNLQVKLIGSIIYKYFSYKNQDMDKLFARIKLLHKNKKTEKWSIEFDKHYQLLSQKLKYAEKNPSNENYFVEAFHQLQLLYNYCP